MTRTIARGREAPGASPSPGWDPLARGEALEARGEGRRRQELALARLTVREEEARRIARDLHDEAGQLLVGVHLAVQELAGEVPAAARPRLRGLRDLLDKVQDELRRICHEMRPPVLDDLGLAAACRSLAQSVAARAGIEIRVTGDCGGRLAPVVESALYRIVQEAVTNAARHSGARQVRVHLSPGARTIRCAVRDDGRGFDPDEASGGLGLLGMRERVEALGGVLRIQSQAGFGTEVLVSVPRREEEPFRSGS